MEVEGPGAEYFASWGGNIMLSKNWREIYSSHPEDYDCNGNPFPPTILARLKEKDRAEEFLRQLINAARHFPNQLNHLLSTFSRREGNGESGR